MHKFFDDLTTNLAHAAKDYNFLFSTVTTLFGAAYFTALASDRIIIGILLFLLFNCLIALSAFGRCIKQIDELDTIDNVSIRLSVFKVKPILILIIASTISCLHVVTEVVIIKAALIFVASILLTEGWTNVFKKQILNQIENKLNEVQ